jgi:hypothetical protein
MLWYAATLTQAFHDTVVEPLVPASGANLVPVVLALRRWTPAALVPLVVLVIDVAIAAAFVAYLGGPALAVGAAAAALASRRRKL